VLYLVLDIRIMKKTINPKKSAHPIGPYSHAILLNKTLYSSGQIGLNKDGVLITQNIESETFQVMKNIENILIEANMKFDNIIKTTIFLKDLNNFEKINNVYSKYFNKSKPARETVEVARLPRDANIEISFIAVL